MGNLDFQLTKEKLTDGSSVALLHMKGSIDGTTVKKFESKTLDLYEEGVKYLILNFFEIGYMNSTGLGILVKVLDKFQEKEGDVKLVKVPRKVADLFDMLGISSIVTIYPTMEDALQSLPFPIIKEGDIPSSQESNQKTSIPPLSSTEGIALEKDDELLQDAGIVIAPDELSGISISPEPEISIEEQPPTPSLPTGDTLEGGISIDAEWDSAPEEKPQEEIMPGPTAAEFFEISPMEETTSQSIEAESPKGIEIEIDRSEDNSDIPSFSAEPEKAVDWNIEAEVPAIDLSNAFEEVQDSEAEKKEIPASGTEISFEEIQEEVPAEIAAETKATFEEASAKIENEVTFEEAPAEITAETEATFEEAPAGIATKNEVTFEEAPAEMMAETEASFEEAPAEMAAETEADFDEAPAEMAAETEASFEEAPVASETEANFEEIQEEFAKEVTTSEGEGIAEEIKKEALEEIATSESSFEEIQEEAPAEIAAEAEAAFKEIQESVAPEESISEEIQEEAPAEIPTTESTPAFDEVVEEKEGAIQDQVLCEDRRYSGEIAKGIIENSDLLETQLASSPLDSLSDQTASLLPKDNVLEKAVAELEEEVKEESQVLSRGIGAPGFISTPIPVVPCSPPPPAPAPCPLPSAPAMMPLMQEEAEEINDDVVNAFHDSEENLLANKQRKELKKSSSKTASSLSQSKVKAPFKRKSAVQYYEQMNPGKSYPLSVSISKDKVAASKLAHVVQQEGKKELLISADKPKVTITPVISGCHIAPQSITLDVTPETSRADFWVTPIIEGNMYGWVDITYQDETIERIDIQTKSVKQTWAKIAAVASVLSPFFSSFMEGFLSQKETLKGLPRLLMDFGDTIGGLYVLGFLFMIIFLGIGFYFYKKNLPKEAQTIEKFFGSDSN